jgi:hypothetical protein
MDRSEVKDSKLGRREEEEEWGGRSKDVNDEKRWVGTVTKKLCWGRRGKQRATMPRPGLANASSLFSLTFKEGWW